MRSSQSLLLCEKSDKLTEERGGQDICLELGSGFTVFPFKERPSLEWPVRIFLSDRTWLKSVPHTPGTKSPVFASQSFPLQINKNAGMCSTATGWLLGFDLGARHRHQLHIASSCLLEHGYRLTCFCGDPQKLRHSGGALRYSFQSGVIIARCTEQRNTTHEMQPKNNFGSEKKET